MWLLSCDDPDLLRGKKLWLRPGSAHLLGRTSSKHASTGERVRYIDHKSVSRKHLVLSVAEVQLGDSSRLFSRSAITASDGSRSGSKIDGEQLQQATKTLDSKDEYTIQLGSLPTLFKLEWRPVVLSFNNVSRAAKNNGTALKQEKEMLEGADIKLSLDYLSNATTHVVAKKRNTPSGLQALLQAKWLVTDSFVKALAEKCKRRGGDGASDPGCSPLEDDFEANWPNEMEFLVPAGSEPGARPNEYLKPDPTRASVFADHTFLFLSQDQLDLLLPVVAAGGGKAVLCEYVADQTTVADVVAYVKQLVGKGTARNFLLSQESGPGGVVIVRIPEKDTRRSEDFLDELSVSLNQRTIEQSELLDAILMKDVSCFRTQLRSNTQSAPGPQTNKAPAPSSSIARPPTSSRRDPGPSQTGNTVMVSDSPPAESQRPSRSTQDHTRSQRPGEDPAEQQSVRRPWRRTATARTNITFTDDYDPSQAVPYDDSSDEEEQPSHSGSAQVTQRDGPAQDQISDTQRESRKRPAADESEEDEEALREKRNERLMPALAAAKRRKTEALARGEKSFLDPSPEPEHANTSKTQSANREELAKGVKGKSKPVKGRGKKISESELEMRAKMVAHREAEEEERRREEEDLKRGDENLENHKPNITRFDVPIRPREEAVTQTRNFDNHPEWRGRPNYKGFRSNKNKDGNRPVEFETQPVVIRLELVPGKDHGLGDDYWLERSKKKGSQSQSQHRQSGRVRPSGDGTEQVEDSGAEDDDLAFRRRLRQSREEDAAAADEDIDSTSTPSQTMRTSAQKKANGKRPATGLSDISAPAPKRTKQATTGRAGRTRFTTNDTDEEEESEDDPLAFRRRRR